MLSAIRWLQRIEWAKPLLVPSNPGGCSSGLLVFQAPARRSPPPAFPRIPLAPTLPRTLGWIVERVIAPRLARPSLRGNGHVKTDRVGGCPGACVSVSVCWLGGCLLHHARARPTETAHGFHVLGLSYCRQPIAHRLGKSGLVDCLGDRRHGSNACGGSTDVDVDGGDPEARQVSNRGRDAWSAAALECSQVGG